MSYRRAVSGFWDGGSGSSGTVLSKTPAGSPDLVRLKSIVKQQLVSALGAYPQAVRGLVLPRITGDQANAIELYFVTVGGAILTDAQSVYASASKAPPVNAFYGNIVCHVTPSLASCKPPLSDVSVKMISAAQDKLMSSFAQWWNELLLSGSSGAVSPDRSWALWDMIGTWAVEMDNALWTGYNVESAVDRGLWAVKESSGEVYDAAKKVAKDAISSAVTLWKVLTYLIRYGVPLAVVGGGVWLFLKLKNRSR